MDGRIPKQPKILFLNQVAGPLFRELAEDVAGEIGDCVLLSGDGYDADWQARPALHVIDAPRYDRSSLPRRALSWVAYFLKALFWAIRVPRRTTLFLVSNPPFLVAIGWLLKIFRGQRYVVLVYDVYPGLLVNLGRLREGGLVACLWSWFNQATWGNADMIITIGDFMADSIRKMLPTNSATPITVVPNWADADFIRPQDKTHNRFAQKIGHADKLTVMYSGNLGDTHDIRSVVEAARRFRGRPEVGFLIIGEGAQRPGIEKMIREEQLDNVTLMSFQPEKELPNTLTTGDVSVVTLAQGIEGFSVPSKTYYMMAAGAALLVISRGPNEMTEMVDRFRCGTAVEPGDVDGICRAIEGYLSDPSQLRTARKNSRSAMEAHYSRANAQAYVRELRPLVEEGAGA